MHRIKQLLVRALLLYVFTVVTVLTPGVSATESIELPNIGDSGANVVTPEQERRIGQNALNSIRQAHALIDDPLVTDYIQSLGYRLVANTDAQGQQFEFFVVDDPGINAFAIPGGYIGVNYGLILDTQSESELAAVLAHEIAHITQHHYARGYESHSGTALATTAALIAAIILGAKSGSGGDLGQAAAASIAAGTAQSQINFTRSNEEEADRIGIQDLARSGFDPNAMAGFFERMQQSTRLYGPELPEFLQTHPVTTARIADARNRARQFAATRVREHEAYAITRARLRVLTSKDHQATVNEFAANLKTGSYLDAHAEHYGYALALLADGQYEAAAAQIKPLLAKDPQRVAYVIAAAQIDAGAGRYQQARAIYQKALLLNPNNDLLTYYYANELVHSGQAQQAVELLQKYLQTQTPSAEFYELLSQAQGKAGHEVDAQTAMAEAYYLRGQLHQAISQLTIALRTKGLDFYRQSKIEARLDELKQEAGHASTKDSGKDQ